MAVLFTDRLIKSHVQFKSEAIQSTSEAMGLSSRSVRRWHQDFYKNNGQFSVDKRGLSG